MSRSTIKDAAVWRWSLKKRSTLSEHSDANSWCRKKRYGVDFLTSHTSNTGNHVDPSTVTVTHAC